jgi:hypothetical protein
MDINDLTIGEAKKLASMFGGRENPQQSTMIGRYVIVRCRDAGVHAGALISANGRGCVLSEARRLWYWKPANNAAFLSGIAVHGLHNSSKVGEPVDIELTENCEIIACSDAAEKSIRGIKSHEA